MMDPLWGSPLKLALSTALAGEGPAAGEGAVVDGAREAGNGRPELVEARSGRDAFNRWSVFIGNFVLWR